MLEISHRSHGFVRKPCVHMNVLSHTGIDDLTYQESCRPCTNPIIFVKRGAASSTPLTIFTGRKCRIHQHDRTQGCCINKAAGLWHSLYIECCNCQEKPEQAHNSHSHCLSAALLLLQNQFDGFDLSPAVLRGRFPLHSQTTLNPAVRRKSVNRPLRIVEPWFLQKEQKKRCGCCTYKNHLLLVIFPYKTQSKRTVKIRFFVFAIRKTSHCLKWRASK